MKSMRMMGLCLVAVFAIAAIAASAASAKGVLVLRTKAGVLGSGAPVSTFSSNLIFESSAGNLECEENELKGTLKTNSAAKDEAIVTEEISKGDYLGIPGACKTSAVGPADIEASGFPWPVKFATKGTGEVKGTKKVVFTTTFLAIEPPNKCTFEASKVKDTFNIGAAGSPEPVTITTTKQTFKHNKKAAGQFAGCPASGVLSGTFSVSSGAEALEDELAP